MIEGCLESLSNGSFTDSSCSPSSGTLIGRKDDAGTSPNGIFWQVLKGRYSQLQVSTFIEGFGSCVLS